MANANMSKRQNEINERLKKYGKTIDDYNIKGEEFEKVLENIFQSQICSISPQKHPIAIVAGGQPGAGKTSIIGNSISYLNENTAIIDNDIYRHSHPAVAEINENYPELFTDLTDQLSFAATPRMIDKMIEGKYNIILHQTLKNNFIVDNAIAKLKKAGYIVIVRALAVSDFESKMSMIERCQLELAQTGSCRWVPPENHDLAYNGLPETIDYMYKTGACDIIEILKRGATSKLEPVPIYRTINNKLSAEQINILNLMDFPTQNLTQTDFIVTPKQAVEYERKINKFDCAQSLKARIESARAKATTNDEISRLESLEQELLEYMKTFQ
ncbi:MAG: zeta toxin family protein [Clostridia bacterium]|nr:zeta toxin family protein [Clostridia bacterium]